MGGGTLKKYPSSISKKNKPIACFDWLYTYYTREEKIMKRRNFGRWMACILLCGAIITGMMSSVVQGAEIISENLFEEQSLDVLYSEEDNPSWFTDSSSGDAEQMDGLSANASISQRTMEESAHLAEDGQMEGSCGLNGAPVYWKLQNGIMTISGTGAVDDYYTISDSETGEVLKSNEQPWYDIRGYIDEVVITDGITTVGKNSFEDCYFLKKITIADSVKTIREGSFANCEYLGDINLGSGIESIEDNAFWYSPAVSLTFPRTLKELSQYSLGGMWLLENIYVEDGNKIYQSKDGVLFSDNGKTLFSYPAGRQGTYTVPDGTVNIAPDSFAQSVITNISFPDTVTEIGESAFWQCKKLTGITFPKNLKVIERYVCMENISLVSVTIPEGVTTIRAGAFEGCTSLKKAAIPSTVVSIGDSFPTDTVLDIKNPGLHRLEDGTLVEAAAINVCGKEEYKKAFQVLSLVNREREKAGSSPLVMDSNMLETAMQRAFEIVLYWSHTRPTGTDCFSANTNMFGENIAGGSSTAKDVISRWMHSEGHRNNILSERYHSIGIGCVKAGGRGGYYWVQCFGEKAESPAKESDYTDKTTIRKVLVKKDPEYYKASFSITKNKLVIGDTAKVQVYWNRLKLTDPGVVISSSNPSVCQVEDNVIKGIQTGTSKITVYFEGCQEKALEKTITVQKEQKVKKLSLNRSTLRLRKGQSFKLKAAVNPSNASNKKLTWKTNNRKVAVVNNGKIVAKKKGKAVITVKAVDGSGKSAKCSIIVK